MPYMKVRRNEKIHIHKRGADGQPEGKSFGSHDDAESADRQLAVLNAAAARENDVQAKFANLDFRPTPSMATESKRGLAISETIPVAPHVSVLADDIQKRRALSPRAIKRMLKVFSSCDASEKGWNDAASPSKKWVMYLMCGGMPGSIWAKALNEQMGRIEGAVKKALNTSNAGSVGFGVPEDDRAGEAVTNAPSKYNLDEEVYHKTLNESGAITGVIRQKSGSVVYHVALTFGSAVCTASDLEHDTTKAAVKSVASVLTQLRFMAARFATGTPIPAQQQSILTKAYARMKAMRRQKAIPVLARPGWWKATQDVGKAIEKMRADPLLRKSRTRIIVEDRLEDAINMVSALQRFPYNAKSAEEVVVAKMEERLKAQTVIGPETPVVAEPPAPDTTDEANIAEKAFKALREVSQVYSVRFAESSPDSDELDAAMDQVYSLNAVVRENNHWLSHDEDALKGISEAVYAEVDVPRAAAWAQGILKAMPEEAEEEV